MIKDVSSAGCGGGRFVLARQRGGRDDGKAMKKRRSSGGQSVRCLTKSVRTQAN